MQVIDDWINDLPQQFRGKKNTETFIEAIFKQMKEVSDVYEYIDNLDINTATGVHLDNIGNILSCSRKQAMEILRQPNIEQLDDDRYRNVLRFIIIRNNSDATYYDVRNALNLLWNNTNIKYREDGEEATFSIDVEDIDLDTVSDPSSSAPLLLHAGGVKAVLTSSFHTELDERELETFDRDYILYQNGDNYVREILTGQQQLLMVDSAKRKRMNCIYKLDGMSTSQLKITGFVVGTAPYYVPTTNQTELKRPIYTSDAIETESYDDTEGYIDYLTHFATLSESECVGEYITEFGLLDADGELVCIATFQPRLKTNDIMRFMVNDNIGTHGDSTAFILDISTLDTEQYRI